MKLILFTLAQVLSQPTASTLSAFSTSPTTLFSSGTPLRSAGTVLTMPCGTV